MRRMTFIETPKAADVLCGKDKTFGKHPGNMLYRDLIEAKALDYAAAVYKLDKMKLTTEIVATMVTEFGTRFLRPVGIPTNKVGSSNVTTNENGTTTVPITSDGNATTDMIGWEEISLTAARDKTSHALRFCAANTVPNSNRAGAQQAPNNNSEGNINNPQGSADGAQPDASAASATNTVPTSLIQSQLQLAMGAVDAVSQEELLLQQNNALQKSIEELVQQKIKQKEQEQKQLEQAEQERQQQRLQQQSQLPASFNETTVAATNAVAVTSAANVASSGLRKFKRLPTKASLSITKSKTKIMPTVELLNSTTTPVKFNRVKVQKSSRKPKVVVPVMTNVPPLPQMPQHQQQQMEQGLNGQHNFRTGPSHVSPSSSPYQAHYQSQDNHPQSSIPGHHPQPAPSSTARTVSTDMIVLAHAAAVVEAAEAEERAAAAQHDEVVRRNTATIASYQQHQRPINSEEKK